MKTPPILAVVALATCLLPPPARAQTPSAEHLFRPGTVALSAYAGGGAFSALHRSSGGGAEAIDVSAQTSGAAAAELVWWLSPVLGLRVHGSLLPSRFDVQGPPDAAPTRLQAGSDTSGYGGVNVWIADVSALIRPPLTLGRVAPYAVAGAGLVSYRPRGDGDLPPGVEEAFRGGAHTAAAAVLGVGAVVPLRRQGMLLSFVLTNHLTRPLVAGDGEISTTSHVRLLAGLTLPLRTGQ